MTSLRSEKDMRSGAEPLPAGGGRMKSVEERFESLLFRSRWLAAPIYLGLVAALLMLLVVFARELWAIFPMVFDPDLKGKDLLSKAVLGALELIDIALVANLVLIVILAGYENFVSRIDVKPKDERLAWMGTIDFAGLKLKLFASMVAITGIELLKAFMAVAESMELSSTQLTWLVSIHATFLFTTVFAALTDWIASRAKCNMASLSVATDGVATHH